MEDSELDGYRCWQLQPILASAASTVLLLGTILGAEEWIDTYKEEMLQSRKDSLPTVMDPMPEQQRFWDRPLIDHDREIVWNGCDDPLGQARLRALMAPHAGVWLQTIPLTA